MTLDDNDVARLRDSIKGLATEDTFGGRFTLIGHAGEGGMGVVYEAKDRDGGRRVAIKVITGLPGPTERARFAGEAEVLERLDHPAIVDYVDHGLTRDGEPYLAMEWLVGESLAARLDRGRLTVAEATQLGERIADALDHAHAHGIVHRDLKPSNIFLVDGKLSEAHLIDFAKDVEEIRTEFCAATDHDEYLDSVNWIADRWASQLKGQYGTITAIADRIKNGAISVPGSSSFTSSWSHAM